MDFSKLKRPRGISTIGTENRVKHYYINNTNLFQR